MKEISTVFDIGPNSDPATVLSLKGNSRLLRDIGAGLGDVYIDFTSASSARIIAGEEEYDLTFADVKSTDVYETSGDGKTLDFVGPVLGRLQVTNSKSGVALTDSLSGSIKHAAAVESSKKKREISMLDSSVVLSADNISAKRTKLATSSASKTKPLPSPSKPALNESAQKGTVQSLLTSAFLLLTDVPVDACASDITTSLFAGLSVSAMYACSSGAQMEYSEALPDAVDVYVEFSFVGGAELGLLRDGEELSFRVQADDAAATQPSTSAGGSSSSSSSVAKAAAKMVRRSIQPYVEAVGPELALCAQSTGLRITALPGKSAATQSLGPGSTIRKHLEYAAAAMSEVAASAGGADACNLLSNPLQLEEHWRAVLAQMALPPGSIDAYSADMSSKVHIAKDTRYLFSNPAVDDILHFQGHTTPVGSVPVTSTSSRSGTGNTSSAGSVGILLDDEGDEVYKCMEDFQRCRFEPFVAEAEAELQKLVELCGLLEVALDEVRVATKPSSTDKGGDPIISARRFLADGLHRRLALYKVLFKESWGLATTYCVFK